MSIKPFILNYPDIEQLEVMCVGDFHIGDRNHSPKLLDEIVQWVNGGENRKILIGGDIFNAALTNSVSDVYSEEFTLDECMKLFGLFIDSVGADNILACVDGNHDQRVWKSVGIDPVKYVCNTKGVRYCSGEAFITLKVGSWGERSDRNRMIKYEIYMTHGVGGGRSVGGKVNNLMRLGEIVVADVYVQGHQHDPVIKPKVIYEWSSQGQAIVKRQQWFIVTGSCLERGGYSVAKAYAPVTLKSPVLTFSGKEKSIKASI